MEHYKFTMSGHLELMDGVWFLVPTKFDAVDDGSGLEIPRGIVQQALDPRRLESQPSLVPLD
jgi:hypothetical protein